MSDQKDPKDTPPQEASDDKKNEVPPAEPKEETKGNPEDDAKDESAKEEKAAEKPKEDPPKEDQKPEGDDKAKEGEKSPEEPKSDDKKDEPKKESKDDVKQEAKEEPKAESKEKLKEEPKEESKDKLKEEPKEESKDKLKEEPKEDSKKESKEESKGDAAKDSKEEKKEEPKSPKKSPRKKKKVKRVVEGQEVEVEEEESEEEEEHFMGEDEYYPDDHKEKDLPDSSLPKKYCKFHGIYGMESYKRYNLNLIEPHVLLYANGNTYELYDMQEKTRKTLFGKDTDGIGSISIHPSKKFFAVAEKGTNPNIYIYSYPDLRLYRICRDGTEKAYSHVEFSVNGDKLASVSSAPDFIITVWNWKAQRVILKSKAFSQEVYRVSFSPYTDGSLVTSGMGHIKFWKMAATFTGLKLQGELGKYGKLEISDCTGFRELPDGKIVSGTEYGTMILWEGRNIKAHLVRNDEDLTPLHKGFIEIIILEGDQFITAGEDGYIRFWNFLDIDTAEFSDEKMEVSIHPIREILVSHDDGTPAYINQMIKNDSRWILGDARGKIWDFDLESENKKEILNFHSGAITDMMVCERKNVAVTLGSDGMVKCWDFINEKEVFQQLYDGDGTSLDWLPYTESNKGRILACGFSTGVFRILSIEPEGFKLLNCIKALDCPVVNLKYSPDGSHLAAIGKDGAIFFFEMDLQIFNKAEPLCMVQIDSEVTAATWDSNSKKFLVGCKSGYVYEMVVPKKKDIDTKETYLVDIPMKTWKIKMMEFQMKKNQKKDEAELEKIKRMKLRGEIPMEDEEEEDEDWDPETIQTIKYDQTSNERFIVTSKRLFQSYYYICDFDHERPLKAVDMPKNVTCTFFDYSPSKDFIIAGLENGSYIVWFNENIHKYMEIKIHDGHRGAINSARFNPKENYILSVGKDGILNVQNVNKEAIKMYAQAMMPGEDITFNTEMEGFETMETEAPVKIEDEDKIADITNPETLSIQQDKIQSEEYWKMKRAEERKADIRNKINHLREEFDKLVQKNLSEDQWIQLSSNDFNIDPEYFKMLEDEINEKKEITKKEVAWGVECRKVALDKLKKVFFDSLEYNRFTVKAIKSDSFVSTFRVKKMSKALEESVKRFKEMIEKEYQPQSGSDDDLQSEGSSQKDEEELKVDKNQAKAKNIPSQFQKNNQQNKKKKTEAQLKREERARNRKARKEELEKHEKLEGKSNEEDPEDLRKLNEARSNFGDYKLKMASDYIVPEKERVNTEKKTQQMILLENSIFNLKSDFNKKLEELKLVRKTAIIELCKEKNKRLDEINKELGVQEELFYPQIDEELEYPENHFKVTMEDIIAYIHKKAKEEKQPAKSSMFGSKKDDGTKTELELFAIEFEHQWREEQKENQVEEKKEKIPVFGERLRRQEAHESEIDTEMREIRKIELEYEKDEIKKVLNEAIESFDFEIGDLQKEKYRLESDLKQAEMKLITFYEELIILNGMEARDKELDTELRECRKEKGKILKEINDIHKDLKKKNLEIQEIKEKEDDLMEKFHGFCPEGSPLYNDILAVYNLKIKQRNPNRADGGEDGDENDDDDEDFDDDDDEDGDEASYKFNQEEHKIDDIEKLRDERLELEAKKQEIEKDITRLHTRCKNIEKEERTIKERLEETEDDIQDFQKLKMDKLNQLQVSIVLKASQIQNLEKNEEEYEKWRKFREENKIQETNMFDTSGMGGAYGNSMMGAETSKNRNNLNGFSSETSGMIQDDYRGYFLPSKLKDSTLFTREGLLKLITRQKELHEQGDENEQALRAKRAERKSLRKLIEAHEKEKKQILEEYNEKQMLRFGSLKDLDSLEVSGPSQAVLDLREKLQRIEKDCMRRREESEEELSKTQRELTKSVKENTGLLDLIIDLGQQQIACNEKLDETKQAILENDDDDEKRKMIKEKQELREVLQIQARKVETLKTEINLYKRKGGHIYTKVTTNRRNANLNQNE